MPHFVHQGFDFHYIDRGAGVPFVFLHGLGGSTGQTAEFFPESENARFISLDCRNHGETQPTCGGEQLGFGAFARDVLALLDHLNVGKVFLGGISMGAGVSIRIALDYPDRVRGLLLVRPAWLDGPMPAYSWYTTVARLLREHGANGREVLEATEAFRELRESSPDAADSLLRQFDAPLALERVTRLEVMPMDSPISELGRLQSLAMPARVIATDRDPIHPLGLARMLAAEIPGASFQEVTSKSISLAGYMEEVRLAVARWARLGRAN